MLTRAAVAVLAIVLAPQAPAADGEPRHERYVADTLEIIDTPDGERVMRLVSRNRQTVRQFWVESVYPPHGTLLVMLEPARGTRAATAHAPIGAAPGAKPPYITTTTTALPTAP